MSDTKPITPEDLARLDAMHSADPPYKFQLYVWDWWLGIRALIAQQAARIAELEEYEAMYQDLCK